METITEITGVKLNKEEAIAIAQDLATCPEISVTSSALLEALGIEYVVSEDDGEDLVEEETTVEQSSYVQ